MLVTTKFPIDINVLVTTFEQHKLCKFSLFQVIIYRSI